LQPSCSRLNPNFMMATPGARRNRRSAEMLLTLAAVFCALGAFPRALAAQSGPPPLLTGKEMSAVVGRVIAATHRNDAALEVYERIEHWVDRKSENAPQAERDRTYRVFPTGTGTLKLILKDKGVAVSRENYHEQLEVLEKVLVWALEPEEAKQRERVTKWKKRSSERYRTIEAFRDAYTVTALGRETREGRTLLGMRFEEKPGFESRSIGTDILANSRVEMWVEESSGQPVRIQALLVRDIAFGGGLLGKVYRGGQVFIEQSEAAPGIWLPKSIRYHLRGRKFLFPSELLQSGEMSDYRRVGPPGEAVELVRKELK
jgi:hypothetical protein